MGECPGRGGRGGGERSVGPKQPWAKRPGAKRLGRGGTSRNLGCLVAPSIWVGFYTIHTNMAAPGERKFVIRVTYCVIGILIGVSVFCVFAFNYHNWNAALWGLMSGKSVGKFMKNICLLICPTY